MIGTGYPHDLENHHFSIAWFCPRPQAARLLHWPLLVFQLVALTPHLGWRNEVGIAKGRELAEIFRNPNLKGLVFSGKAIQETPSIFPWKMEFSCKVSLKTNPLNGDEWCKPNLFPLVPPPEDWNSSLDSGMPPASARLKGEDSAPSAEGWQ